jgi:hypothetical protein
MTSLSSARPPGGNKVVHKSQDYEVRIVEIDLGAQAAYLPLARKYAVVHREHEVVGMVTELLPQAIAACEGLQASLEQAQSGNFGQAVIGGKLPPSVVN